MSAATATMVERIVRPSPHPVASLARTLAAAGQAHA
jgi:hypothetical protein